MFNVLVRVFGPQDEAGQEMEATVYTGATYSMVPRDVLAGLGVPPLEIATFELADGTTTEYDVGDARMQLGSSTRTVPVTFGPSGAGVLLGATALEIFRLAVDPVRRQLLPVNLMLKRSGVRG